MNLIELQNKIHQQNRELGWWDEPRPFSTFVCLFHSELSEAMEGDRKGLMDDHLPKYPMFQVELADFVIRCLDWLGSASYKNYVERNQSDFDDLSPCDFIAKMHSTISMSFDEHQSGRIDNAAEAISACVEVAFVYSKKFNFDLHQIILEKVEYNKHRADHKRENRAKDGGKKY